MSRHRRRPSKRLVGIPPTHSDAAVRRALRRSAGSQDAARSLEVAERLLAALIFSIGGQATIKSTDVLAVSELEPVARFSDDDGAVTLGLAKRGPA